MAIKTNSNVNLNRITLGTTDVQKVYSASTLIWTKWVYAFGSYSNWADNASCTENPFTCSPSTYNNTETDCQCVWGSWSGYSAGNAITNLPACGNNVTQVEAQKRTRSCTAVTENYDTARTRSCSTQSTTSYYDIASTQSCSESSTTYYFYYKYTRSATSSCYNQTEIRTRSCSPQTSSSCSFVYAYEYFSSYNESNNPTCSQGTPKTTCSYLGYGWQCTRYFGQVTTSSYCSCGGWSSWYDYSEQAQNEYGSGACSNELVQQANTYQVCDCQVGATSETTVSSSGSTIYGSGACSGTWTTTYSSQQSYNVASCNCTGWSPYSYYGASGSCSDAYYSSGACSGQQYRDCSSSSSTSYYCDCTGWSSYSYYGASGSCTNLSYTSGTCNGEQYRDCGTGSSTVCSCSGTDDDWGSWSTLSQGGECSEVSVSSGTCAGKQTTDCQYRSRTGKTQKRTRTCNRSRL